MTSLSETTRPWTRESLAAHIERAILAESLPEGGALPSERQLSGMFGVSRSLIREVLRGLEQRGLLEVRPGKGAYVRTGSRSEAARSMHDAYRSADATHLHLAQARYAIEAHAAELAAGHATALDISAMATALIDLGHLDGPARTTADLAFHIQVTQAAGNPVLLLMLESLQPAIIQHLGASSPSHEDHARHIALHSAVLEAITAEAPTIAVAAMAELLSFEARSWTDKHLAHDNTPYLLWTAPGS